MSYRILVHPDTGDALRTLPEHVLRRAGQLLAEISELAEAAHSPTLLFAKSVGASLQRLESDCCVLLYEIDRRASALTVVGIETREEGEQLAAPA
jgi:mRNA-degrading endonuclease RelE of RelBE toxin-antitoxin system